MILSVVTCRCSPRLRFFLFFFFCNRGRLIKKFHNYKTNNVSSTPVAPVVLVTPLVPVVPVVPVAPTHSSCQICHPTIAPFTFFPAARKCELYGFENFLHPGNFRQEQFCQPWLTTTTNWLPLSRTKLVFLFISQPFIVQSTIGILPTYEEKERVACIS